MLDRDKRAVDRAPEVGLHQPLAVTILDVPEVPVDRQPGDVDPGVEAAESCNGAIRYGLQGFARSDICDNMKGLAAFGDDASLLGREGFGVPRHQHHFSTALDRHAGSGQADAA